MGVPIALVIGLVRGYHGRWGGFLKSGYPGYPQIFPLRSFKSECPLITHSPFGAVQFAESPIWWDQDIFKSMACASLKPNAYIYSATISACERGAAKLVEQQEIDPEWMWHSRDQGQCKLEEFFGFLAQDLASLKVIPSCGYNLVN